MASLEKRYYALFRSVEGARLKTKHEHTDRLSREKQQGITQMNPWHRRILYQLDFCLQMKEHAGTDVEEAVDAALTVLESGLAEDGVLTDSVCRLAEQCLLPLAQEAKTYTLLMVGHAHLDMNWQWGWDETVATVVATFKTMLKLMEEYPDFCFSQSQTSTYKIIEDYAPELMPQIQQRIREGRWEITAAAWVETDKNMPSTESLMNHIRCTKRYLQEHWDIDPDSLDLDFSPDTFGHSAFLPELDTLGGVKYYYHCRGLDNPELILYRWQAPSGRQLLMYREPYWYNSGITPAPCVGLPKVAKMSGGLRTGMAVYGVGDHGGGPTRRDLNNAREMQKWPVYPVLRFGTFHDYFKAAESVREKVPVVDRELNRIFTGCYTTQSRIKRGNRRAETALRNAETLNALTARELGEAYADRGYEKAWQNTLLTHFHDIITGSCVQDSREYAMGLYQEAFSIAGTRTAMSMETVAREIDTSAIAVEDDGLFMRSEGAGVGFGLQQGNVPTHEGHNGKTRIFHVFNLTGEERTENARITVWDWPGDLSLLEMTDAAGNVLPCEQVTEVQDYWAHLYFDVLTTVTVPARGYTTVVLREKEPEKLTDTYFFAYAPDRCRPAFEDLVLENNYLRAAFDGRTGQLYSLTDKQTGRECLRKGETAGLRDVRSQRNDMSSWVIDRWLETKPLTDLVKLKAVGGKLEPGVETEHRVRNSRVTTTVTLGSEDRFLKVQLHVDWKEEAANTEDQPLLVYLLPLAEAGERMLCDVPGGVQWRKAQDDDVPCQRYCAAELEENRVLALAADCKYGFRYYGGDLSVTLINTGYNPDPYPERGIQDISLFVLPAPADGAWLAAQTDRCLNSLQYMTGTVHGGSLPVTMSLLQTEGETAVFSGVSMQDGKLAIRVYETAGKACPVTVTLRTPAKEACVTDLSGRPLDIPVTTDGCKVSLTLPPYRMAELRIQ